MLSKGAHAQITLNGVDIKVLRRDKSRRLACNVCARLIWSFFFHNLESVLCLELQIIAFSVSCLLRRAERERDSAKLRKTVSHAPRNQNLSAGGLCYYLLEVCSAQRFERLRCSRPSNRSITLLMIQLHMHHSPLQMTKFVLAVFKYGNLEKLKPIYCKK